MPRAAPSRGVAARLFARPVLTPLWMRAAEPLYVRCPDCRTVGAVEDPWGDPVLDRAEWLQAPCPFTPGCAGRVDPDALN